MFTKLRSIFNKLFISPILIGLLIVSFWMRTITVIMQTMLLFLFFLITKTEQTSSSSISLASTISSTTTGYSVLDFIFGISFVKWTVKRFIIGRHSTKNEKTENHLPFFYKNSCQDCNEKIFEKASFPKSIVILEPPYLSSNKNSTNTLEYPKTLKYALSHPTSLTIQLFCHLYGIPFVVEQSDEVLFLVASRTNNLSTSSSSGFCPVFIKIDNSTVIKGKDSSHLIEQLFKFLLPFGSQVDAPDLNKYSLRATTSSRTSSSNNKNMKDEEDKLDYKAAAASAASAVAAVDSGIEADKDDDDNKEDEVNSNDKNNKNEESTTRLAHSRPLSEKATQELISRLPQCCQMRLRLYNLFRSVGDPLTGGISGQLSSSDSHRNVNLRRIIDSSVIPLFEHVLKNGMSMNSCASLGVVADAQPATEEKSKTSNSNKEEPNDVIPYVAHSNFLSFLSSSSIKKSLISIFLSSRECSSSSSSSISLDQLILNLKKSLDYESHHQQQDSSSSKTTATTTTILDKIRLLSSTTEGILRILFLATTTSSTTTTKSENEIFDELIQSRLKEDLSLLERFIAATTNTSSSAAAATTSTKSNDDDDKNNKKKEQQQQGGGTFLFDSVTPTIADCAVLSICLAAVHSEQVPGFYYETLPTSSSSSSSTTTTSTKKELKIHALEDFVRRRSVKKYMERCMQFFYPGSVVGSSSTASKKSSSSSGRGGGGGKKDDNDDDQNQKDSSNDDKSKDKKKKSSSSSAKKKTSSSSSKKQQNNNDDEENKQQQQKRHRSRSLAARNAARERSRQAAARAVVESQTEENPNEKENETLKTAAASSPRGGDDHGDETLYLFGTTKTTASSPMMMKNADQVHHPDEDEDNIAMVVAPDTDAHNEDDDDNDNDKNDDQEKNASTTSIISPPASPLLKAMLDVTSQHQQQQLSSKSRSRSTRCATENNNNNNDDDYDEEEQSFLAKSAPAFSFLPEIEQQHQSSLAKTTSFLSTSTSTTNTTIAVDPLTISQRDLKKVVSGTHLLSPHNRERSWLKRSGSSVLQKASQRKKWENDLLASTTTTSQTTNSVVDDG